MKEAPIPKNEKERIERLYEYSVLNSTRDPDLDNLTKLASRISGAELSLVSLVDKKRQFFKSVYGSDMNETPRDISFCGHTIMSNEPLIVEDALEDERFYDNELCLSSPNIRFYAGFPLVTPDDYKIGTLCVISSKTMSLSDEQIDSLKILAANVMSIIELKHSERKLFEYAESSSEIQAISNIGGWEYDLRSNQAKWTDQVYKIYGVDKEKTLTKDFCLSFYASKDRERLEELFEKCVYEKTPYDDKFEFYDERNNHKWVRAKGRPEVDKHGNVISIKGTFQDITEQVYVQKELNSQMLTNEKFFDLNNDLFCIFNEDGSFYRLNSSFEKILEYSFKELYQKTFFDLIENENKQKINEFLESGQIHEEFSFTNKHYLPDDRFKFLSWSLSFERDSRRFFATARDITTEKNQQLELDEALRAASKSAQARSLFLSTMSHEIRTPLNGIVGLGEILSKTDLDEEQAEFVKALNYSGNILLTIINDILDFSKIDAGMMELEKMEFSLCELGEIVLKPHEHIAKEKGIILNVKYPQLKNFLIGDSSRISQIINNLVSNAIKFTAKGEVNVSFIKQKKVITIKVVDTGVGISKNDAKKVFNAFSQADASINRRFGGTGLGLSICKKLVDLMGGTISFKSTEGKGCTFVVNLPFQLGRPIPFNNLGHSKHSGSEATGFLGNVLVAEDNKVNQMVLAKTLDSFNVKYTIVNDGLEAIESLDKDDFNLILMDCQMPRLDGLEATRQIRGRATRADIPIVAITASATKEEEDKCYASGMNDYISKPIRISKLELVLSKYLQTVDKEKERSLLFDCSAFTPFYEMDKEGADEFISSLITQFLETSKTSVQKIFDSLSNENYEEIPKICHSLRPAASSLGAHLLYEYLVSLEGSISTKETENLKNDIEEFKVIYDKTCDQLAIFNSSIIAKAG